MAFHMLKGIENSGSENACKRVAKWIRTNLARFGLGPDSFVQDPCFDRPNPPQDAINYWLLGQFVNIVEMDKTWAMNSFFNVLEQRYVCNEEI